MSSSSSSSSSVAASLFLSCSWTGILGATGLVLLTTLDDCVWLVPFVAAASTRRIATLHAGTFLLALEGLAVGLSVGTYWAVVTMVAAGRTSTTTNTTTTTTMVTTEEWASSKSNGDEPILAIVAAILCWVLAGYLIFKKWQKQRRRKKQQQQKQQQQPHQHQQQQQQQQIIDTAASASSGTIVVNYGTIPLLDSSTTEDGDGDGEGGGEFLENEQVDTSSETRLSSTYQPGIVISLTCLGFLDEVAYFPSLILGHVFSAMELCIGTLLAGLVMIGIVTICLATCQPFIDWLDTHVKMYGVVTIFAIVLTIQVILDNLADRIG